MQRLQITDYSPTRGNFAVKNELQTRLQVTDYIVHRSGEATASKMSAGGLPSATLALPDPRTVQVIQTVRLTAGLHRLDTRAAYACFVCRAAAAAALHPRR